MLDNCPSLNSKAESMWLVFNDLLRKLRCDPQMPLHCLRNERTHHAGNFNQKERKTAKNINLKNSAHEKPFPSLLFLSLPRPISVFEERTKYFTAVFVIFMFVSVNAIQVNKRNVCNSQFITVHGQDWYCYKKLCSMSDELLRHCLKYIMLSYPVFVFGI